MMTSITFAAGISTTFDVPFTAGYILGVTLGSLLPDLDKRDSLIGQYSFGLARLVQLVFGHRGFTHSLLCWLLISMVCYSYPSAFSFGLSLGYLAHIIGDFFSSRGVPLLYPLVKKHFNPGSILTYRTGSTSETLIFLASTVVLLFLILNHSQMSDLMPSVEKLINL